MPDYLYECEVCKEKFKKYVSPIPPFDTVCCPYCGNSKVEEIEIEYFDWEDRYLTGFCWRWFLGSVWSLSKKIFYFKEIIINE